MRDVGLVSGLAVPARKTGMIRTVLVVTEIYRSHDGRWTIERAVDRYLIHDEESEDPSEEVWSTSTLQQLYDWLAANGLDINDFDETGY